MTRKESLAQAALRVGGRLLAPGRDVALAFLESSSCLPDRQENLRHRSVMIAVRDQLLAAMLLIEVDGIARRMVLCPPELKREHLGHVIAGAEADVLVSDAESAISPDGLGLELVLEAQPVPRPCRIERLACCETEWVLLTSGTTGEPKLVSHTLQSLTSAFRESLHTTVARPLTWSTFYDIRRYGGLQIFLRALYGGSMVLSSAGEPVAEFLSRARASGVTHISGTPSHWRKVLMSGAAGDFSPAYVRLSGEIADQGILDALRAAFPKAVVAHAYASTEGGVGFEVDDGLTGFPASFIGRSAGGVEIEVCCGILRLKSPGSAARYLGENAPRLRDAEGFVDTGDRLELRAGRYYFAGRSGGIINVGGQKVYPEEVEAVINAHPKVHLSRVYARHSPITGAVVTAEVVLTAPAACSGQPVRESEERLCQAILEACRTSLPAHKVPASIRIVPSLELSASGKLVRPNA